MMMAIYSQQNDKITLREWESHVKAVKLVCEKWLEQVIVDLQNIP